MKNKEDLKKELIKIDHKSYGMYKTLGGSYSFGNYILYIDHVQGDPFASPSRLHFEVKRDRHGFPEEYYQEKHRRLALEDQVLRRFLYELRQIDKGFMGSGKSGRITICPANQTVQERIAVVFSKEKMELRFEMGFPARGRTILAKEMQKLVFDILPQLAENTLFYRNWDTKNKKYPITQSSLESLASTFQKVEAVRELKNADALSDYGLDKPTYTVSVKDKTGKSMTYYIGNATGENYYVTYGDKSKIYTVSSDITSSLSYSLDNLIETDTFPTLSTGNLKKVLVTQNGKTKTYTSKKKNLDGISGGLGVFTFGDCQNYYASRTDLVKYGLDKDSRITVDITYKDTDTKKTKNVVLYIGKKDSDQKNYYVQLKGSHMVYLSDKDVVKNILNP